MRKSFVTTILLTTALACQLNATADPPNLEDREQEAIEQAVYEEFFKALGEQPVGITLENIKPLLLFLHKDLANLETEWLRVEEKIVQAIKRKASTTTIERFHKEQEAIEAKIEQVEAIITQLKQEKADIVNPKPIEKIIEEPAEQNVIEPASEVKKISAPKNTQTLLPRVIMHPKVQSKAPPPTTNAIMQRTASQTIARNANLRPQSIVHTQEAISPRRANTHTASTAQRSRKATVLRDGNHTQETASPNDTSPISRSADHQSHVA